MLDLKLCDLSLGKVKETERSLEVCIYDDVQISIVTWGKEQNANLAEELLVPPEAALRQAVGEAVVAVKH